MNSEIVITKATQEQRQGIVELLLLEKLPVEDLPESMENFFVALDDDKVVGVVGLEVYGSNVLLRSLAVEKNYRNKGIADKLISELEKFAAGLKAEDIYLLTETAEAYFVKKNFAHVNRNNVPAALQASSEFSHTCPVSAIVMKKKIIR